MVTDRLRSMMALSMMKLILPGATRWGTSMGIYSDMAKLNAQ